MTTLPLTNQNSGDRHDPVRRNGILRLIGVHFCCFRSVRKRQFQRERKFQWQRELE